MIGVGDRTIKQVRLSEREFEYLVAERKRLNITVSQVIRNILDNHISNSYSSLKTRGHKNDRAESYQS